MLHFRSHTKCLFMFWSQLSRVKPTSSHFKERIKHPHEAVPRFNGNSSSELQNSKLKLVTKGGIFTIVLGLLHYPEQLIFTRFLKASLRNEHKFWALASIQLAGKCFMSGKCLKREI